MPGVARVPYPPLLGRPAGARPGAAWSASVLPLARPAQAPMAVPVLAPVTHIRRKIWEFDTNLHCSIIGTCLTTAELRRALVKLGYADAAGANDHEVHATGVRAASRKTKGGKILHKVLDRCHRAAISRFDKAKSLEAVRALWQESLERGEVPGAYWAALTHPAADDRLIKDAFTEVHMLSHLVGAANRADIRRLRQLEEEKAALEEKVERQQTQLRDIVTTRDAKIRELSRALEASLAGGVATAADAAPVDAGWEAIAADLQRRLGRVKSRAERLEHRLVVARAALAGESEARAAAKSREAELRLELEAIEASLADPEASESGNARMLDATLLYVGGRPARIGHLRELAERSGAEFLHHDGGIEERESLLPGLVSRADAVLFPVDCISHAAMLLVKRLCQQVGKPFLPLRGAGLAPFCAALKEAAWHSREA
ncbi:MAG: DUF2325 domain-containing protein [Alphaproteobacteria bacterium]|nr:DUF2325 domain-containing protein [Alphaproteobacteria bacterium]